jgi:RNA polymerase sigma-70 factor (ECF subfamily)
MYDAVVEEMLALDPGHREVLILRFVHGMSHSEIAEILDRPVGTVKSELFRALNLLRERIKP